MSYLIPCQYLALTETKSDETFTTSSLYMASPHFFGQIEAEKVTTLY